MAGFLLEALLGWNGFIAGALLISLLYLLLEQQYLFKQKLVKTVLKSVYITVLYGFTLALFMGLAFVLSVALT